MLEDYILKQDRFGMKVPILAVFKNNNIIKLYFVMKVPILAVILKNKFIKLYFLKKKHKN